MTESREPFESMDYTNWSDKLKQAKEEGWHRHCREKSDERPWGRFEILFKGPTFQIKLLTIHKDQAISLQYHKHRSEHWTVVQGVGQATIGDEEILSLIHI